jgi:hypothetical protein
MTTIQLSHASTQWKDPDTGPGSTQQDFRAAFRRQPLVQTFSEVFTGNERVLRDIAPRFDYKVVEAAGNDAVCVPENVQVLDSGHLLVNPGVKGKPPLGGHSERYALWVLIQFGDEVIFDVTGHWVTGRRQFEEREQEHDKMSQALVDLVHEYGRKTNLAFVQGDINASDREGINGGYKILHEGGITTCWDEIGAWPATHGQAGPGDGENIDFIGSYGRDTRVSCNRAVAHPKESSDHNPVTAWWDIAPKPTRAPFQTGQLVIAELEATVAACRKHKTEDLWAVELSDIQTYVDSKKVQPRV